MFCLGHDFYILIVFLSVLCVAPAQALSLDKTNTALIDNRPCLKRL